MTTLEILKAARAKIAKRKNWTRHYNALGKSGRPVDPAGKFAVCFCANGAVMSICAPGGLYFEALEHLRAVEPDFIDFNDTHSHTEVLAIFDKAIAPLEAA